MTKQVQESAGASILAIERSGTSGVGRVDAVEVSRQVGARRILQELSLSIEPGELVAIAGDSGAGKTTLLEILTRDCNRRRPAKFNTKPASIDQCDRVVFLARDGHLAFIGSPTDARRYFEVNDVAEVYVRLAVEHTPQIWAKRFADIRAEFGDRPVPARYPLAATRSDVERASAIRQWWLLTRRNVDVLFYLEYRRRVPMLVPRPGFATQRLRAARATQRARLANAR